MQNPDLYYYSAMVTSVYDGDTVTVDIDLGFGVLLKKQKIRLLAINTPEIRGEERPDGLIARDFLREKILNKQVIIKTFKDSTGKYGRWLGVIYKDGIDINQLLLDEGYAVPYK
jgi:micrococcal nuclease